MSESIIFSHLTNEEKMCEWSDFSINGFSNPTQSLQLHFSRFLFVHSDKMERKIYETMNFFRYTLNFFGLSTYNVNGSNKSVAASIFSWLQLVLALVTWTFIFFEVLRDLTADYEPGMHSKLLGALRKYHHLLEVVIAIFVTTFDFMRKANIKNVSKIINKFDTIIKKLKWCNHENMKSFFMAVLIFWTTFFAMVSILIVGLIFQKIDLTLFFQNFQSHFCHFVLFCSIVSIHLECKLHSNSIDCHDKQRQVSFDFFFNQTLN